MGANMGRQIWERAMQCALKAADADPTENYDAILSTFPEQP